MLNIAHAHFLELLFLLATENETVPGKFKGWSFWYQTIRI
jgi:hypothetical protein